jgi:hypothetical protein
VFRLRYSKRAKNALANLWLNASPQERTEITRASHEIDRILTQQADTAGESRIGNWRVLFEEPLGVVYFLEPDGQTVSVTKVWLIS